VSGTQRIRRVTASSRDADRIGIGIGGVWGRRSEAADGSGSHRVSPERKFGAA
jgi:hypothetical protein